MDYRSINNYDEKIIRPFNKNSGKEILQYAVGGLLYTPGNNTKIANKILQKKLPDILTLNITEHKPLALYNDGILVADWSVIHPKNTNLLKESPALFGPEKLARSVYEMYCDVNIFLERAGYHVYELGINDNNIWSLRLSDGVRLILGNNDDIGFTTDQNNVFMWRLNNDMIPVLQLSGKT